MKPEGLNNGSGILVTGDAGRIGGLVVEALYRRGLPVRAVFPVVIKIVATKA